MRLEQSFTVAAPADEVWRALVDVERVAPCLPGAEVTEAGEDGEYRGTFTVKLGPTTVVYAGTLRMEQVDEAARTAVMAARGTDRRGQGGATATIASAVREEPGGATSVDVVTDFTITGRLARFGRGGMIEDVSRRLLGEFARCLQAEVAGVPAAATEARAAAGGAETAAAASAGTGAPAEPAATVPPSTPPSSAEPFGSQAGPAPGGTASTARPLDAGKLGRDVLVARMRRWWAGLGQWLRSHRRHHGHAGGAR
jgi:carbon monoxide dehydrogenase subunit G